MANSVVPVIEHHRTLRTTLAGAAILGLASALAAVPAAADDGDEVDLALTSTVTASGQEVSDRWGPELTIDGDHGPAESRSNPEVHNALDASRWSANTADDAWIELHLAQESEISEIAVDWGNTFGRPYALSVSDDGLTWDDVATGLNGVRDGIVSTPLEEPVTASHVRLQISGKSQQWSLSIWEIEVLGVPVGEPPTPLEASLVPLPASVAAGEGEYALTGDSCVSLSDDSLDVVADRLREAIGTSTGLALPNGSDCDIDISIDEHLSLGYGQDDEAYTLDVDDEGVHLAAPSPRGALWGVQTLAQLLGPWTRAPVALGLAPAIQHVHIEDAPRYAWRGFMLDPARSFWPVDEVESMIDLMAQFKMNVLHMHLSDDQGWRIAIDNEGRPEGDTIDYTNLTERSGSTAFMAGKSQWAPEAGRTGYYTKDAFRRLVAYAAERGIMVVPEIDGPGHANSMLYALDELNTEGAFPKPAPGNTRADAFDESSFAQTTLDPRSDATYAFLTQVVSQIVSDTVAGVAEVGDRALAPTSPYFHLGGDESSTTTGDDYAYYMERATGIVEAEDLTSIVWNEAVSAASALPEGTVIQHWTGGVSAAERAFVAEHDGKILMSQVGHAYYPQRPTADLGGPSWACAGACGIDTFYNWNPTAMAGVDESGVLGVEGPMWSEHLRTLHDMQFLVFPRLLAHAEVGWTPQVKRSFGDFTERVADYGTSLVAQGATFQLVPEITGWHADFAPAPVGEIAPVGGEVLVGHIAAPGTADVADLDLTATLAASGGDVTAAAEGDVVDLRLEMERAFHYTDTNRTTGRIMNSLITVYADLPELAQGGYDLTVAGDTPAGDVRGTAVFEVAADGGSDAGSGSDAGADDGSDGGAGDDGGADADGGSDAGSDPGADSGADGPGSDAGSGGAETSSDAAADRSEAASAAEGSGSDAEADGADDAATGGSASAGASPNGPGAAASDGTDPGALPDTGVQPVGIALAGILLATGSLVLLRRRGSLGA